MKTVSSLKGNNKGESPKTPGGISKSLLTPCRRVGLSRNWRKAGPSPFVSPLSGSAEVKQESADTPKKRKLRCDEDSIVKEQKTDLTPKKAENAQDSFNDNESLVKCNEIDTTPSRNLSLPQRKRSKTSITSKIDKSRVSESSKTPPPVNNEVRVENGSITEEKVVTTPLRTKSKSKNKKLIVESVLESTSKVDNLKENLGNANLCTENCKQKSPENLTKECIVVIQKKIFKKGLEKVKECNVKKKDANTVSQALFDSDTDDVPLSVINKNDLEVKEQPAIINLEDDDDFVENTKAKVKKLEDKTTSTGGLSIKSKDKRPYKIKDNVKKIKAEFVCPESKPASQCSFDDDEDFDMDKRTILVRKSYNKVIKPMKAKSTGSITQKDIDDLKARIEMKKKLFLAKAMTKDTEELRNLIKKWQKGCQDALVELMELMKLKFPDKQNMDYSEILQTLKIPASMVGYDEENDNFVTPTDENIILSKFNDL